MILSATLNCILPVHLALIPRSPEENSLLKECRGLVFSPEGKILSRRYHKFFNINEKPETKLNCINFDRPYVILEKLDGSMVAPFLLNDKVYFGTRLGASLVSNQCEAFVSSSPVQYIQFCKEYLEKDYSPIFEWCSKDVPIILHYKTDALVLTALRHNFTGKYMLYSEMVEAAHPYSVPVIKLIQFQTTDVSTILKDIQENKELEGCVIRFDDGDMYKVKTEWYNNIGAGVHKFTKSKHNNEKYFWKTILENKYDDLRPYLGDKQQHIDRFAQDLLQGIQAVAAKITSNVTKIKADTTTRAEFSEVVKSDTAIEKEFHTIYFLVWAGKDARESLVTLILKKIDGHFEEATKLAGGIKFQDYKPK